jgi:hypothetical protein
MKNQRHARFASDPFGYSALAWHQSELARALADQPASPDAFPSSDSLKSPILWLTQAHALTEAASAVLRAEQHWDSMPNTVRGICDSQYCASALMLVGYSAEICLKGLLILTMGVEAYVKEERSFQHHKLERLAKAVLPLTDREVAVLRALTHFTEWAGRYPDPGSGRDPKAKEVFSLSEEHHLTAADLFGLLNRIFAHARTVVSGDQ